MKRIKKAAIFLTSIFFTLLIMPLMFVIILKDFMDMARKGE